MLAFTKNETGKIIFFDNYFFVQFFILKIIEQLIMRERIFFYE